MDGLKEQHHHRLHAKDLKKKQKHRDANNPAGSKPSVVLPPPQQFRPQSSSDEEPPGEHDNGDDFTKLLSQTASGGLILKAEQDWNKDITLGSGSEQFSHYFDLDVQRLADNICKIPFHERFDLHDVEIRGLRETFIAEAIGKTESRRDDLIPSESLDPVVFAVTSGSVSAPPPAQMPIRIRPSVVHMEPVLDPKEDIQGWLDNVLDI